MWEREKNQFNKDKIKKFDYLTYSLSEHKIYYVLYSLNMLYLNYKGENGYSFNATRVATLMDSSYISGIKVFWDSLMNHKNIYTGIKYKDDSALAFIILTNENSVDKLLRIKGGKKLLRRYWNLYKGKYGFSKIQFPTSKNSKTYKYLLQFAAKEDSSYFMNMKEFLRSIGVKVPMTFTNNPYSYYTQKILYKIVDFICVHTYGKYAVGNSDKVLRNSSPLVFNKNIPPAFPTRMLTVNYQNKPIVVDEWNIGYPSIYRIEPIILIPILSAYNDYDGVFYFLMYAHGNYVENPHKRQKYYLTSLENPYSLQVLFIPIMSYMLRNAYIPVNKDSLILNIGDKDKKIEKVFQYKYNPMIGVKGLLYYIKRVIIRFTDKSNLALIKLNIPKNNIIKNNNLFWNYRKGIFSFVSKRYFTYAGKGNGKFRFKGFEINSNNNRLYLVMMPLDRKILRNSNKIIIVVGEDSYHDSDKKIIDKSLLNKYLMYYPGKIEQTSIKRVPSIIWVKPVNVDIYMPYNIRAKMGIYALYPNGKQKFISHVILTNNHLHFDIDTGKYKTCYYILKITDY
ncbi:MAG: hypothetical protein GWP03_05035 [Proteobacteria bacterium]|nr:hypothetical protein [Pseudomonadota bacterium]